MGGGDEGGDKGDGRVIRVTRARVVVTAWSLSVCAWLQAAKIEHREIDILREAIGESSHQ